MQKKDLRKFETQLVNLRYDLTPQKYLSMIVCDMGNIPPHSVPVVIQEILDYEEGDEDDDALISDDSDDLESSNEGEDSSMLEQENEEDDELEIANV